MNLDIFPLANAAGEALFQRLQGWFEGINAHSPLLFWLRVALAVVIGAYLVQRVVSDRVHRPTFAKQDVVYQERSASGNSQKNLLTKMGGASNCLRLIVTRDWLWITPWFPFSLFAALYDLEHFIPLRSIRSIEGKTTMGVQTLLLTYVDDAGKSHALRLRPKNLNAFMQALEVGSTRHGTPVPAINVVPEEPIPTLRVALRRYWPHLLAVGLLPAFIFVGTEVLRLPFGVFVPVFFATMLYGAWPGLTRKAPSTYQFVMGVVWIGGGSLGVLIAVLVFRAFGNPPS